MGLPERGAGGPQPRQATKVEAAVMWQSLRSARKMLWVIHLAQQRFGFWAADHIISQNSDLHS